jgi:hypothetical protein
MQTPLESSTNQLFCYDSLLENQKHLLPDIGQTEPTYLRQHESPLRPRRIGGSTEELKKVSSRTGFQRPASCSLDFAVPICPQQPAVIHRRV